MTKQELIITLTEFSQSEGLAQFQALWAEHAGVIAGVLIGLGIWAIADDPKSIFRPRKARLSGATRIR